MHKSLLNNKVPKYFIILFMIVFVLIGLSACSKDAQKTSDNKLSDSKFGFEEAIKDFEGLLNKHEINYWKYTYNRAEYALNYDKVYSDIWCYFQGTNDIYERKYEDFYDSLEEKYGNYKISIEVSENQPISKDSLDLYVEPVFLPIDPDGDELYWEERYQNYKEQENDKGELLSNEQCKEMVEAEKIYSEKWANIEITDGYKLKLKINIDGDVQSEDIYLEDIVALEIYGEWIVRVYPEDIEEKLLVD